MEEPSSITVFKPKPIISAHARSGGQVIIKKPREATPFVRPNNRRSRERSQNRTKRAGRLTTTTSPAASDRPLTTAPLRSDTFKLIPLGGFGEIGKNIIVYDYQNSIIVFDCGVMFPEEEMLGIDLVIPDVRYLEENKNRIKAWFFTHGHEDHIGSAPYILPRFPDVPIFGGNLTVGMVKLKLEEVGVKNPKTTVIKAGDKLQIGPFSVEVVQLAHSIPDDLAFAIRTSDGLVMHVADWKIDHTPLFGQETDLARLSQIGVEGVDLLVGESTGVEVPGYTLSEQVVADKIDEIFKSAAGRIIIAMFASNINRIQQVFNAAVKARRKVAVSGRSMEKNIQMALSLGYLSAPEGLLQDIRRINSLPPNEIVILSTGAQGEEYSALARMASGEHRSIKIRDGDTVVVSASVIPGNERPVRDTIDNLFKLGATVVYGKDIDVHVSGHAQQEELKLLLATLKPKHFVPMHGEYRMLKLHARMAVKMGTPQEGAIIAENGEVVELENHRVKKLSVKVQAGAVLVDGLGIGDVGAIVLRDRQAMAKEGIFVLILTVDRQNGRLLSSPDIISRGFIYMREREDLVSEARQEIRRIFARHNERSPLQWDMIKRLIRDEMSQFLYDRTNRQPMVIPVIIEI